ncbi:hypothetical protein ACHAWO_004927 [Cyclotella atomus]|uniref:Uncharacterized protein n=1 Tax=Cyclotella atomus TaxID=382360 RepID=A0ABD3NVZ6_9STRA
MTTKAAQQRARNRKASVDAPRIGVFQVSESTRFFGDDPLDDSENSSPSLPGKIRGQTSKSGPMDSIISGDGSCDSENIRKVASGENTAQGVKKVSEESKNGNPFMAGSNNVNSKNMNPFMDGSNHSSNLSNRSNRVGPFESGYQDFMVDDMHEEEIDVSELVVEKWNQSYQSLTKSDKLDASSRKSRKSIGALDMVDKTKDTYDGSINYGANTKKGYYNLSQHDDRNTFMTNMNGVGGRVPGEQVYNDEEDQTQDSPLFRADNFKKKGASMMNGLSKDNPFADDEDSLRIETHKPRSNGMESNARYASMQEMLDEEHALPFSAETRKGIGGFIDKTFGEKKSKRRKITAASVILLICGGIGAALYVILGMKPADSEFKGSEMLAVPTAPTQAPSRAIPNGPTSPSFLLPSSLLNTSGLPPFGNIGNSTIDNTVPTTNSSTSAENSTAAPSKTPENETSTTVVSIEFNISTAPTVAALFNRSSSPSIDLNTSITPTPQPSIIPEGNSTANETIVDTDTTDDDELGKETISANETLSLVPTPVPLDNNSTESLMPSVALNESTNITDLNETTSSVPTPTPSSVNVSGSIAPSTMNVSESIAPSSMNVSESLMPSVANNETLNATDANNETDANQTMVPTPSPSAKNASESLMPSVANASESLMPSVANASESLMPSIAMINETASPTLPSNESDFLDELSDPWKLYKSYPHDEPSSLFGTAVAMSADPMLLVVGAKDALNEAGDASGAVYVYSLDDNGKSSQPHVLYGENAYDEMGSAIAISDDGTRIVIGYRSEADQTGAVRVYSLTDGSYTQLGDTIVGAVEGGRTGWAVSISGDGSTVAVGAPKGGAEGGGSVRTYQFDGQFWVLYGSEIEGGADASVGYSVSLSFDGGILAVGNPKAGNREGSVNAGKVATYMIEGSEWSLAGEVYGIYSEDVEGTSVALSPDGMYMVTGSKGRNGEDGSIISTGSCQLYQNSNGRRWRLRNSLIGQSADERLGTWVSISRDSSVFACGGVAATLDGFGTYGVVRAYNRRTSSEAAIWPRAKGAESSSFGASLAFSPLGLAVGAPEYSGGSGGSLTGNVEIFSV